MGYLMFVWSLAVIGVRKSLPRRARSVEILRDRGELATVLAQGGGGGTGAQSWPHDRRHAEPLFAGESLSGAKVGQEWPSVLIEVFQETLVDRVQVDDEEVVHDLHQGPHDGASGAPSASLRSRADGHAPM